MVKYNNSTTDRDPGIYLGIDGNYIPFEYFDGVYKTRDRMMFSDHPFFWGTHFIIHAEKGILLMDSNSNAYVTKEDLVKAEWYTSGYEYFAEGSTQVDQNVLRRSELNTKVLDKYLQGFTGDLTEEEKVYDSHGDWMMERVSFNTEQEEILLARIRHHVNFIYKDEPWLPWEQREMILSAPQSVLDEIRDKILIPQVAPIFYDEEDLLDGTKGKDIRISNCFIMGVGKIFLRQDERIQKFIIRKYE